MDGLKNNSGSLVASGQVNHMGFRAHVIIWNWNERKEDSRHEIHKVSADSMDFKIEKQFKLFSGVQRFRLNPYVLHRMRDT